MEMLTCFMTKAFIEPDLETAHIRIVNSFNPFSGLLNPIYTLKSAKVIDFSCCADFSCLHPPPQPIARERIEEVVKDALATLGKTAKEPRTDYYYGKALFTMPCMAFTHVLNFRYLSSPTQYKPTSQHRSFNVCRPYSNIVLSKHAHKSLLN